MIAARCSISCCRAPIRYGTPLASQANLRRPRTERSPFRVGMIDGYSTPSDLGAYLTGRDAHAAMIALEAAAETINAAISLIKERVAEAGRVGQVSLEGRLFSLQASGFVSRDLDGYIRLSIGRTSGAT